MEQQVKSRQRVQDHGEVFTNEREVNAMLDMVKAETERIESRFLEPACGDGNFLAEVLRRKLAVVAQRYSKSLHGWERYAFVAVASLYGVEILTDNAQACRDRLFGMVEDAYAPICKKLAVANAPVANSTTGSVNADRANSGSASAGATPGFLDAIRYVLAHNITCGNALSMRCVDAAQQDTEDPIIFSEWSLVTGDQVKRRDFRLDELVDDEASRTGQAQLFSYDLVPHSEWAFDDETGAYIPEPIKEYSLTSIYEVAYA